MLSMEFKVAEKAGSPDEAEIYCDRAGLEALIAQLDLLRNRKTEHVHLMSIEWGGTHLEDVPKNPSNAVIRHLKIIVLE